MFQATMIKAVYRKSFASFVPKTTSNLYSTIAFPIVVPTVIYTLTIEVINQLNEAIKLAKSSYYNTLFLSKSRKY